MAENNPYLPPNYIWGGCVFTPANFSYQHGYTNSGNRSNYIPSSNNLGYPFKEGFKTKENSKLYTIPGSLEIINEPVFFTINSRLFRGEELGIATKKSVLSTVSRKGIDEPEGYMLISSVFKPSPLLSNRLANGKNAQEIVGQYFKSLCPNLTYETNLVGSSLTDLKLNINNKTLNVEIKSSPSGLKSLHTMFDKSVRRNKPISHYLECVSKGFCTIFNVQKGNSYFESLMDHFKKIDPAVGFAGDIGVARSGKVPKSLMSSESHILSELSICIINHFRENGDHYFCILDRSTNQIHAYFVGIDPLDNIFDFPSIPELVWGGLQSYGGNSHGATRIALKVKFKN